MEAYPLPPNVRRRLPLRLLAALLLGVLAVEVLVMPLIAAKAPLALRIHLPSQLFVLSQSSKQGLLPRDWTLLVGDSYAQGYGDWLGSALAQPGNPPFHAGHVLHRATGRDVVSFGKGGAGSMKACVYQVSRTWTALRRTGLDAPSRIVVLVYEGNDFLDNLEEARRYGGLDAGADAARLARLCEARAQVGTLSGLASTLFFPGFLASKLAGRKGVTTRASGTGLVAHDGGGCGGVPNVVRTGSGLARFDGPVQGPPLGLEEGELAWSVRILTASLAWLRARFPQAPIDVVYVPAPILCYEVLSNEIDVMQSGSERRRFRPDDAAALHARLVEAVAGGARGLDLGFHDATAALRRASSATPVHGPSDGSHLGRAGYTALGHFLAELL